MKQILVVLLFLSVLVGVVSQNALAIPSMQTTEESIRTNIQCELDNLDQEAGIYSVYVDDILIDILRCEISDGERFKMGEWRSQQFGQMKHAIFIDSLYSGFADVQLVKQ